MTFSTNPLKLTALLVRQRSWLFVVSSLFFLLIHVLPVLTGVFMGGLFDALTGAEAAGAGPWTFRALALATAVTRTSPLWGGTSPWVSSSTEVPLPLRNSVLGHPPTAAGSRRL